MLEFADIVLIALSGVLFTLMIDQFLDEDMIFSFWGRFLERHDSWILKPLWGCNKCTNTWMVALMMVLFTFANQIWVIVFIFSLGNLFLDVVVKVMYPELLDKEEI